MLYVSRLLIMFTIRRTHQRFLQYLQSTAKKSQGNVECQNKPLHCVGAFDDFFATTGH